jgi:hypothetical protein
MNDVANTKFGFSGNLEFDQEIPVLTMQVPLKVLKKLIAGPSTRSIEIQRHEIVGLLQIIKDNPETPEADRKIIKQLLGRN